MWVQELRNERYAEFLKYCEEHGKEHDESYLPDKTFVADIDNPTYVLIGEEGNMIGVVSVIMTPDFRVAGKVRFRIFHSVSEDPEAYNLMLGAILKHLDGMKIAYLFLPKEKVQTGEILIKLGFHISRYAYYMERCDKKPVLPQFPENLHLCPIREGVDEEIWCRVLNECFAHLAGSTPWTPDRVSRALKDEELIKDGMMILWDGDKGIGTLSISKDEVDGKPLAYIGCVTIMPEYRGRNLGRNLIRAAVQFGWESGCENSSLSVDAKNTNAARLYLSEGFEEKLVMACYNMDLVYEK